MKSVIKLSMPSIAALGLLFSTVTSHAEEPVSPVEHIKTTLKQRFNLTTENVSPSPIKGYYQVFTDKGLLYVSDDGKQLIQGKVFDIQQGVNDLTEAAYTGVRLTSLAKIEDSALVYPAKNEKFQVSVFTDITCGYCRKMHSEIEQFNELGITVKYYAYPRGGLNSKSSRDLDVIWCDENPEAAMTAAKRTGRVNGQACATSPVDNHFNLGSSFGVGSTPALVFEDGTLIPGYKPPKQLLALLESKKL